MNVCGGGIFVGWSLLSFHPFGQLCLGKRRRRHSAADKRSLLINSVPALLELVLSWVLLAERNSGERLGQVLTLVNPADPFKPPALYCRSGGVLSGPNQFGLEPLLHGEFSGLTSRLLDQVFLLIDHHRFCGDFGSFCTRYGSRRGLWRRCWGRR